MSHARQTPQPNPVWLGVYFIAPGSILNAQDYVTVGYVFYPKLAQQKVYQLI